MAFFKNLNFYVLHFSPNFLDKKKKLSFLEIDYCTVQISLQNCWVTFFFYFSFIKEKRCDSLTCNTERNWVGKICCMIFFVIVSKLIQDSRYDREPIFQFALLLFADLLPFNSYGRKVFTTINQSKLQKSNIQHGKLLKNIGLQVHSESSIRFLY